ncbi:MAG: hypothetical protein E4H01_14395 [Lysobacterales bacterium]|nr:MAG: hypothetical protein E4H01_14395 [Xanthomonadales bacterium]
MAKVIEPDIRYSILAVLRDRHGMDVRLSEIKARLIEIRLLVAEAGGLVAEREELNAQRHAVSNAALHQLYPQIPVSTIANMADGGYSHILKPAAEVG